MQISGKQGKKKKRKKKKKKKKQNWTNETQRQKRTFWPVRTAKIQFSLRISAVCSESSLDAF